MLILTASMGGVCSGLLRILPSIHAETRHILVNLHRQRPRLLFRLSPRHWASQRRRPEPSLGDRVLVIARRTHPRRLLRPTWLRLLLRRHPRARRHRRPDRRPDRRHLLLGTRATDARPACRPRAPLAPNLPYRGHLHGVRARRPQLSLQHLPELSRAHGILGRHLPNYRVGRAGSVPRGP